MACREQALSNDYAEALVDYILRDNELDGMDYCVEIIDDQFAVLYFNRLGLPPISISDYTYNSIPKLYGLMQPPFRYGGLRPAELDAFRHLPSTESAPFFDW